jgi:transcriptional regulator with XRE-family HTH domain
METFWDRVRIFLSSPSVVDLAAILGVKRSTLSSWIHNDRRPPMDVLLKIQELTGLTLGQLEYGWDYHGHDEEEVAESVHTYRREVSVLIDELQAPELKLLKSLLPYLKTQTRKQDS